MLSLKVKRFFLSVMSVRNKNKWKLEIFVNRDIISLPSELPMLFSRIAKYKKLKKVGKIISSGNKDLRYFT